MKFLFQLGSYNETAPEPFLKEYYLLNLIGGQTI